MGQSDSKLNGSFTFAYVTNTKATTSTTAIIAQHISEEEEEEEIDNILRKPEIYGLSELVQQQQKYPFFTPSSALGGSSSYISIDCNQQEPANNNKYYQHYRDSGYILPYYDESIKIINDLDYIDTAYYSNDNNTATTHNKETITKSVTSSEEIDDGAAQLSFTDALLASPDKTLQEVHLSCRSILRLSPNIGMLTMIRKLDLSHNYLTELPDSIGYMQNLESLILTRNRLKLLPDTIGYLSNLAELDLSFNEIQEITPCINYLDKLKTLSVAFNQITYLPVDISGLTSLISLDLSKNLLQVLPAEISQLPYLRRIRLDDCPFKSDIEYPLKHNAPTLVETCARIVKREEIKLDINSKLPEHMINYIQSAKSCTFCHGPYYESFVLRGRLMEKTDMHIPLQYTLCSAHWSDADDRILSMFSAQPSTSSQVIHHPYRPNLPYSPKIATTEKSNILSPNNKILQSVPVITESNVTFETSAFDDISINNNQLFPAATTTTITKISNQRQMRRSSILNSFASKFKKSSR